MLDFGYGLAKLGALVTCVFERGVFLATWSSLSQEALLVQTTWICLFVVCLILFLLQSSVAFIRTMFVRVQ